jgi:hypothetical protein
VDTDVSDEYSAPSSGLNYFEDEKWDLRGNGRKYGLLCTLVTFSIGPD